MPGRPKRMHSEHCYQWSVVWSNTPVVFPSEICSCFSVLSPHHCTAAVSGVVLSSEGAVVLVPEDAPMLGSWSGVVNGIRVLSCVSRSDRILCSCMPLSSCAFLPNGNV